MNKNGSKSLKIIQKLSKIERTQSPKCCKWIKITQNEWNYQNRENPVAKMMQTEQNES